MRVLKVELLKVRTARLTYGQLGAATALTALLAVLRAASAGSGNRPPLSTDAGLTRVLTALGFTFLIATVFGATVATGEFHHGSATSTCLAFPDRARVLLAKVTAAAAIGLAFGALGFAASTAVGLIFAGGPIPLGAWTIAGDGAGAVLASALLAALGVALGSLVRTQVPVVVGLFVWAVFAETILGGVFDTIAPYLPFTAATTLAGAKLGSGGFGFAGGSTATPLPFTAAAAIVLAVIALISTLAARTTVRADIT